MSRRTNRSTDRPHRTPTPLRQPAPQASDESDLAGLVGGLDQPHPLEFLRQVSSIWAAMTVLDEDPLDPAPDAADFVAALASTPGPWSTAVLTALRHFISDFHTRRHLDTLVKHRTEPVPEWLATMGDVTVVRVVKQSDPVGDTWQMWLELRWPDGTPLCIGVLVDALGGNLVVDSVATPIDLDAVVALEGTIEGLDASLSFDPWDPADARAQVLDAIGVWNELPSEETDSWPLDLPLVAWAVRLLPGGGASLPDIGGDDVGGRLLVREFLDSPHATFLGRNAAPVVANFVEYGALTSGDPLQWSPRKIGGLSRVWRQMAPVGAAAERSVPVTLRAFVLWCADRIGLAPFLVQQNLDAVSRLEPTFLAEIEEYTIDTSPYSDEFDSGPYDSWYGGAYDDSGYEPMSYEERVRETLEFRVGGAAILDGLDAEPLPDEEFDESGIEEDLLPTVLAALDRAEGTIAALDVPVPRELRTAARRFVRCSALGDPAVWRREARIESSAFGVVLKILELNGVSRRDVPVRLITEHLGMKSAATSRVHTLYEAAKKAARSDLPFLTGPARASIIEKRDALAAGD